MFILAERLPATSTIEDREGVPHARREASEGWDPDRWDISEILDDDVDLARYGIRDAERGWLEAWNAFVRGIDADTLPGFPIWVDAFEEEPLVPPGTPKWKADFLRKNSALLQRAPGVHRPVAHRAMGTAG